MLVQCGRTEPGKAPGARASRLADRRFAGRRFAGLRFADRQFADRRFADRRLLADRRLRYLLVVLAASGAADGFGPVTVSFAVLRVTGSAGRLGLVLACQAAAALLLTLAGGLAADRFPRGRIMAVSLTARAGAAALLAATLLTSTASFPLLLAAAAGYGCADGFFGPASSALLPEIVPRDRLARANALLGGSASAAAVAAPALAGLTVAALGPGAGFAVQAALLAAAGVLLAARLPTSGPARPGPAAGSDVHDSRAGGGSTAGPGSSAKGGASAKGGSLAGPGSSAKGGASAKGGSLAGPGSSAKGGASAKGGSLARRGSSGGRTRALAGLRAGWVEFTGLRWLWLLTGQWLVFSMLTLAPVTVLGPAIAQRYLGGAAAWGVISASLALGSVAGQFGAGRVRPPRRPALAIAWLLPVMTAEALALGLGASLPAVAAAAAVTGLAMGMQGVLFQAAMQASVRPDVLARVAAIDLVGSEGGQPVGYALAGPLAATFGAHALLTASAAVMAVAGAAFTFLPGLRTEVILAS